MSKVICIMGESGSGKTTSLRNLNPKETFIVDSDRKGLSWKNWKKIYNKDNKNYAQTSSIPKITNVLSKINKEQLHIKTIVIDTINTIMIDDEMSRSKEKGYDKWQDLAFSVWELVSNCHLLRDDLTIIFMAHTQTDVNDSGYTFTRLKTSGKKLDKIVLESKFTTVLLAKVIDGKYIFETRAINSTAKTPMGAFETDTIDNDVMLVIQALDEF